jgi:hypothetical protein
MLRYKTRALRKTQSTLCRQIYGKRIPFTLRKVSVTISLLESQNFHRFSCSLLHRVVRRKECQVYSAKTFCRKRMYSETAFTCSSEHFWSSAYMLRTAILYTFRIPTGMWSIGCLFNNNLPAAIGIYLRLRWIYDFQLCTLMEWGSGRRLLQKYFLSICLGPTKVSSPARFKSTPLNIERYNGASLKWNTWYILDTVRRLVKVTETEKFPIQPIQLGPQNGDNLYLLRQNNILKPGF